MENNLTLLHQKIDTLSEQVAYLTTQANSQQRRQQELDDLKSDMFPIVNHMIKLSIDELAEIGDEFQIEDLLYMLKRMMRNTSLILAMFNRLEAIMGVADEAELLGKQVFNFTVEELNRLERQGYFGFAREGWGILQRIVTEFSEGDVQALGDNIVTILTTIRNMTQPEIMALANNAIGAIQEDIPETTKVSIWTIVRELGDPKVRRGMVRMMNLLKALDDQSESNKQ